MDINIKDYIFSPYNDTGLDDTEITNKHKNLVKNGKYSEATELLDENEFNKGFRASIFNTIQNKIRSLEEYFLNEFAAEDDELYSFDEPTEEQMKDKTWWIQLY